ncbi:TlpA family protein disulfide reductase [Lacinutrix salivirga]
MKPLQITFLALILFTACKKDSQTETKDFTYFGGEIVNPKSNFVIVYKSNTALDTLTLDKNNRFLYKIEDINPGIYSFYHAGEYQLAILEPKDSIVFRLNTLEFDESLVFTGKGSKKNNYLINKYLEYESENKQTIRLTQLSPLEFEKKVEVIKNEKEEELSAFIKKHDPSELFIKIAKANINYSNYNIKELYPFVNYKNNELDNFKALPANFYDYRETIDYNDETLKDYYPYYTFLRSHFNNIALQEHFKHSKDTEFNKASLDFNLHKMKLIDQKISNQKIKDALLNQTMIHFVNASNNIEDYDAMFKVFNQTSKNKKHIALANAYINSCKQLKIGNKLPNFIVEDYKNNTIEISKLLKQPTVIYFWSYHNKSHFIDSHFKAKELKVKYPKINFIAINVNSNNNVAWKNLLKQYDYKVDNEYHIIDDATKELLAANPINKVILLDKEGKIVNSKANMFNISFEQELLGLVSK